MPRIVAGTASVASLNRECFVGTNQPASRCVTGEMGIQVNMTDAGLGALDFVLNSINGRAAHYREWAAHLRMMAEGEPVGHLREKLAELADQFEELAGSLMISRRI